MIGHLPAIVARARARAVESAQRVDDARRFWNVKAAETEDAADELWIYDEIGFSWWDDGITAKSFAQDLATLKSGKLTLRVNSPGGDVFDGLAIKNLIAEHPADVTARVDGLAASIASVIVQAANTIEMAPHSQMMIHDASGLAYGNAQDMTDMADLLNMISDNIATVYADAAGGTASSWRKTMKGEKWYTADEAVAAGLADVVDDASAAKRKTQPCAECDGDGCDACDDTGRVPTEGATDSARRLRLAAKWCEKLFPGHEQAFRDAADEVSPDSDAEDALDPDAENGSTADGATEDPAPDAPAVQDVGDQAGDTPNPAGSPDVSEAPTAFTWTDDLVDALVGSVARATRPPEIDLGDWRAWFGDAPAAREPERNRPVDLGPPPDRPAPPDTRPTLADLIRFGVQTGEQNAPAEREPERNRPVDLGPPPDRPAPPAPAQPNRLADLIGAAVRLASNDQPAVEAPPQAPVATSEPPFRLDVDDVRRAIKESRY
jgi:ATP-dependent protease ClpP protease subunit